LELKEDDSHVGEDDLQLAGGDRSMAFLCKTKGETLKAS
jgi:hypothetical protein